MHKKIYVFVSLLYFVLFSLNAQHLTKIYGKVTDAKTGEPIPFANIVLKNTNVGTISNIDGKYSLETKQKSDSIICEVVGYNRVAKKIMNGKYQTINFALEPSVIALQAVVVKTKRRKKTVASMLVDSMRAHREQNDKKYLSSYQYNVYNKVEFDINNITDKFRKKKVLKPFQFIFNYTDTSTVNGSVYLPVMIIETYSKFYYQKSPKIKKEKIIASKIAGVSNESINQFLGNMYTDINVWDSYVKLFDKGFVSPISFMGKVYYKYFIIDSLKRNDTTYYHIGFTPKLKEDYVFNGDFWIQNKTFALTEINLQVGSQVNLNFVNNLKINQKFTRVQNHMMLKKEYLVVDFNIVEDPKNAMGFFGKKTTIYTNIKINTSPPDFVYKKSNDVYVEKNATQRDSAYWAKIRPEKLSKKEAGIYHMIDSIKSMPIFRTYYDIINTIVSGHYTTKWFEWGPYSKVTSYNPIEGVRIMIGGRTNEQFSKHFRITPYLAYGFYDKKVKGGISFTYYINKMPWRELDFSYQNDMKQLGEGRFGTILGNNILKSVLTRRPIDKLSLVETYEAAYTYEFSPGISTTFILNNQKLYPVPGISFDLNYGNETKHYSFLQTTDFTIHLHTAYKEKFVFGKFKRISLGSKYPSFDFYLTKGVKNFLKSNFSYSKFLIKGKYKVKLYPFGHGRIFSEYGKIMGKLPFPLLKIHEGNETYYLDKSAFNMMNYYEFISDEYLSISYFHYFDGLFLNKIPLLKKLKWRTTAYGKFLYGKLSPRDINLLPLPSYSHYLKLSNKDLSIVPDKNYYSEVGLGIENIFKFISVNFVWRLTQLNNPNISKFGIRFYLDLKF